MTSELKQQSEQTRAELKKHSGLTIALGVILIIIGLMAIVWPAAATLTITVFLGWALVFAGIIQFIHAFATKGAGAFIWKLLMGIFALIVGVLLLANPIPSVLTLTLLLTMFLMISGIFNIIAAFAVRPGNQWGMMLFGGIMSLLLGWLIWSQWPISAAWIIGLLVGMGIFINGWIVLFIGIEGRS